MQSRYRGQGCDGIRLTHSPSGTSVVVWCDHFGRRHSPHHPAVMARAKSWLLAKRNAAPSDRPVRSYHLTGESARIAQGGRVLASGRAAHDALDGVGLDRVMTLARR